MLGIRRVVLAPLVLAASFASPASAFDPASRLTADIDPAGDIDRTAVAQAYEPTATEDYNRGGIFDEVRLGGAHFWQDNHEGTEDGAVITGQVLFDTFVDPFANPILDILLRPRPHVGALLSFGGTDQVFAGLTWTVPVGPVFFLEGSFGGTIHNGDLDDPDDGTGLALGCHLLFRESAALGVNLGRHWTVTAGVNHSSHAGLCGEMNNGLSHIGGTLGYRF